MLLLWLMIVWESSMMFESGMNSERMTLVRRQFGRLCTSPVLYNWGRLDCLCYIWRGLGSAYAYERLLKTTLPTYTAASKSTCRTTLHSNSRSPPPAMPPDPSTSQWMNCFLLDRAFPEPRKPAGEVDERNGRGGAIMQVSPREANGFSRLRVKLAVQIRRTWVMRSSSKVAVRG